MSADIKPDVKQPEISELVAVSYKFYRTTFSKLEI